MPLLKPPFLRILVKFSCMRNAQTVLHNINVFVHDGIALILTGANGSGKTTFLRMLPGFSSPSAEEILCNGHDITTPGVFRQYKLQLNWSSMKDAINNNYLFWIMRSGLKSWKVSVRNPWGLELMGLGRLAHEKERMLSMGQRKRLQLAIDGLISLLDEPSVALDDGAQLWSPVFVAIHLPIKIEDSMSHRLPQRLPRRKTLVGLVH